MKKLVLVLFVLLCGSLVVAQDAPRVEVFGGYQYFSLDSKDFGDRQSMNGWDADVAFPLNTNVSLVGDFSGAYKSEEQSFSVPIGDGIFQDINIAAKLRIHNFLFGPRVSMRSGKVTPFAHALFGVGRTTVSGEALGVDVSESRNGFAMALGGGVDVNASEHFAIRVAKFDYVMNRINDDQLDVNETLNNFRFAAGVVFRF